MSNQGLQQQNENGGSSRDSLLGVLCVQAFFGAVCPAIDQGYDVAEAASEIYTDRMNGKYKLGVKNSLGAAFNCETGLKPLNDMAEIAWEILHPTPRTGQPALAF